MGVLLVLWVVLTALGAAAQKPQACAPWCPKNSVCVNASACRCNPGFKALSGDVFTDPTDTCEDINECAPPRSLSCGRFADCKNVDGSYYCECIQGYELTSGERNFSSESQNTCQDVNECTWKPGPCHSSTHCINKAGGYVCRCRPGWEPVSGSPNGPNNTICQDVDECSSGQHQCHNSTVCHNTIGAYKCRCRPGWEPVPGSPNGPNNTVCQDVDECSSGQHQCHNSTVCHNTIGAYKCYCRPGWELMPGFPNGSINSVCQDILSNWTLPPGVHSLALSQFLDRVQALSRDFKTTSAKDTIQNLIQLTDELLGAPGDLQQLAQSDQHRVATQMLSGLEQSLRMLAKTLTVGPFVYRSHLGTELSLVVAKKEAEGNITIGQSHARVLLDWAVASEEGDSGNKVAGILSSPHMNKTLLASASLVLEPKERTELEAAHEIPLRGARPQLLSAVSSVFVSNRKTERLSSPVTFAFSHLPQTPGPRQKLICAFWKNDSRGRGHWATTGCRKLGSQNGSITCQCDHLSSFAVLMAHFDFEDPKLALVTKVGLSLSLVCLLLCILTFLLVRSIQGSRTTVHLHLCVCLFVGSAIFLAGIENEGGQVGLRCRLVAALLHYCFLAAFCWMSLEGLQLYFLVVRVFQGQGPRTRWLCLFGYGVPLLIVAISAAVNGQGYGRDLYCWLSLEGGFLWSFVGPVTAIVLCNAVVFVITVWRLTQKFSEINPDMKKLKKARVLTVTAIAQLFVLGCTWVFGLFLFQPQSWHNQVLAYTFTALNCLQGLFLFALHCLLNKKVREEYRKWACIVAGNKYSEFASSSTATSHQSSRVPRPSESGM
ncbi:adhesion G protein-coupled receptor E5 isoform X1 [Ochotona princeps]|uniref:adhesion G protein-coupled receptor E5 isoform X1 n=1 Tax=Ochotona princeps TaxID=9978 RepID=UPI0027147E3A|nr:adhesion G protein-coupled receptor E5 isoform X1 [Ochotona princeps]